MAKVRFDKEKIKEQLTRLADFEVEWLLRMAQEEHDKRNFDWVKGEGSLAEFKPKVLVKNEGTKEEVEELE